MDIGYGHHEKTKRAYFAFKNSKKISQLYIINNLMGKIIV